MLMRDQSPLFLATVSCQLLLSEPHCWKGCSHQLEAVGCSNRARQAIESLQCCPQCPWRPVLHWLHFLKETHRVAPGSGVHLRHPHTRGEVSCRPTGSWSSVWYCCSAYGTPMLVNGLNTMYFICQQVLWLKAWDESLLFLLSLSFCAVASLFQLSVCAWTIWHSSVPVNVCCFQGEKLLITIWMVRGLGMGFISTSEPTVPQVGSSWGKVSRQPLAVLPDGCVRKGGQKSHRTRCKGGAGSSGPWQLSSAVPRCRPAAGASQCWGSPSSALLG